MLHRAGCTLLLISSSWLYSPISSSWQRSESPLDCKCILKYSYRVEPTITFVKETMTSQVSRSRRSPESKIPAWSVSMATPFSPGHYQYRSSCRAWWELCVVGESCSFPCMPAIDTAIYSGLSVVFCSVLYTTPP